MQIELLKNKDTNVVERLSIQHYNQEVLKAVCNLNLTHEDSMVYLGRLDIKWHNLFINYDPDKKLEFLKTGFIDFNQNKEVEYFLNYFVDYQDKLKEMTSDDVKKDMWFINYYFWCMFYIMIKDLCWSQELVIGNQVDEEYSAVYDPMILFCLEGIDYLKKFNLITKQQSLMFDFIFYMDLDTKPDSLFKYLKDMKINNQNINLLVFEKEILLTSEAENQDHVFWMLKQKAISGVVLEIIKEKNKA
ncbi:hypothetical protein [Mesoplasma lactucae]|uniref:Uncharacterized protein n=1 Tax=Mesoplasma lactucae ATCC 49193 TaxID=81460 RepID=A0A291IRK6_9MOLU|nr:hypothetical protein [Mesoplasma lactucae]ATG97331.1 hypothetical protein CP520_00980 [Mesoplasma lactucae ATCC 49193]ATZ20218.1 hypothetical protein MLACT_v1c03970 [Mesoplasma lactucae ATCC 49193]MCL8216967.1 hypothetical protein [Mesoplasma lactucae ATCC 49193]